MNGVRIFIIFFVFLLILYLLSPVDGIVDYEILYSISNTLSTSHIHYENFRLSDL